MKRLTLAIAAVLLATVALAQDKPSEPPYSKDKLLLIFKDVPEEKPERPNVQFGIGYVDFRALGQRWRFNAIMMPLSGSIPWASNDAFGAMPDPFALTGTTIPYTARTWRNNRALSAEIKRIEKTERAKVKVTVGSSQNQ